MKFAAIIEYGPDKDQVKAFHPAHREYLRHFLENGQLRAAGPFADDAGALWVLDAESAEAVEEIVKGDPYVAAGVIVSWKVRPHCLLVSAGGEGSKVIYGAAASTVAGSSWGLTIQRNASRAVPA